MRLTAVYGDKTNVLYGFFFQYLYISQVKISHFRWIEHLAFEGYKIEGGYFRVGV